MSYRHFACHFFIAFIMLALAPSVQAGPWLREKGTTFSAVSFASTYYLETASATYLEYGLTDDTTLVGDFGMARLHYSPHNGYVTASVRRALSAPDAASKWAYELGVGVGWVGEETLPHIRTALSWGKGRKWGGKSGWMTVEAAVIWDLTYARHVGKIDTTMGVDFTEVTTGMLQIYTAFASEQSIATIAPSLVFTPKNGKFRLQVGSESELGNLGNSAIKFGLWREF